MGHHCCQKNPVDLNINKLEKQQKKALIFALIINSVVFLCELYGGFLAHSKSILADSVHLFSHLFVIILTLLVLKKNLIWKARAAFIKGLLIASLGFSIFLESFFSLFLSEHFPDGHLMGSVAIITFIGNGLTLWVLAKHRTEDINMKSAWVCTQADLYTNLVLILVSILVSIFHSGWPDSLLGLILGGSILRSALKLLWQTRYQLR